MTATDRPIDLFIGVGLTQVVMAIEPWSCLEDAGTRPSQVLNDQLWWTSASQILRVVPVDENVLLRRSLERASSLPPWNGNCENAKP